MGQLVFQATLGGAINLSGPNTASTVTFTLPSADGTSGQAMITNGSGTLSLGNISLTSAVTGTLPVANGGTGATSITANGVVLGNGTSAVTTVAPSTSGNVLTSNGTTWTSGSPGVTSVATGNGLSGGTITSTGGGGVGGSADLGLVKTVVFVTGSTVLTNDNHVVLVNCSAQSITLTLPSASSAGIRSFIVKKIDSTSNNVTISGSTTSEKIDGNNSISFYTQYECFTIIGDATSSWYIV